VFAIRRRRRRTSKSSPEMANFTLNSVDGLAKDVDRAPPAVSLSLPSTPLDSAMGERPVVTQIPIQVVDDAPPKVEPQGALIADSHHPLRAQSAGVIPATTRAPELQLIDAHDAADHTNLDMVVLNSSRPPQVSPVRTVLMHEPVFASPPLAPATASTSMDADRGEPIGGWETLLRSPPASSTDSGIVAFGREHTGNNRGEIIPVSIDTSYVLEHHHSSQIREIEAETTQPEVERLGNVLARLYDSRSTDVVHDPGHSQAANLRTVSKAEADAVQALLDSDAHNKMIVPSVSGAHSSSPPFVGARKAPVSEDMVRFYQYTELSDGAHYYRSRGWYTRI
jgi:hypothetical protein